MPPRKRQHLASIVGANIAALRAARGWNQTQLAEKLGMGADSLSRMERGVVAPRFARLELFADILGCTVAELFFTAADRARLAPAAAIVPTMTYSLKEETAPYGDNGFGAVAYGKAGTVSPTARNIDHTTVEEIIFMSERIAALLKQ